MKKVFLITFVSTWITLVAVEYFKNGSLLTEHILGWAFVATTLASLVAIAVKNNRHKRL